MRKGSRFMKKNKKSQLMKINYKLQPVVNPLEGTGFENAITFQANSIIEACRNLTLLEARLFYLSLIYVRPQLKEGYGQEGFVEELIPSSEVIKIFSDSHCYNKLKKVSESLQSKLLYLKNSDNPDDGFCRINIFNKMQFDSKIGGLLVEFNEKMRPYLLYLYDKAYTRIALRDIFCLGSPYAIRVLELMLEYQNIEIFKKRRVITRKVSIEYLRSYCMIDESKYKTSSNFTQKVVDVAVNEINSNTVYNILYTKVKTGNKLTGYIFNMQTPEYVKKIDDDISSQEIIAAKQEIKVKKANAEMATLHNPNADAKSMLIYYGVGKIVAARLAKSYPREHIINNIRYSLSQQHRVRNMGAYIARAIKEDYYSSRGTDDGIKSLKQLEEDYKANLEAFLEEYDLPAFWAAEFMDDDRISANRRNSTFARKAAEQGFDLESLLISVQKRQIPEPPKFEKMEKLVPESEINTTLEPIEAKDYPRNTDLEKKLQNPWIFHQIIDYVRDGKPLDHFVEPRVIIKGLTLDDAVSEAKRILGIDIADEAPSENIIKKESVAKTDKMAELRELFNMYQAGFLTEDDVKKIKEKILSD